MPSSVSHPCQCVASFQLMKQSRRADSGKRRQIVTFVPSSMRGVATHVNCEWVWVMPGVGIRHSSPVSALRCTRCLFYSVFFNPVFFNPGLADFRPLSSG